MNHQSLRKTQIWYILSDLIRGYEYVQRRNPLNINGRMLTFKLSDLIKQYNTHDSILREPVLYVYLAMVIHNKTRSLELIEALSKLGLCISKHRLSNLSTSMGNTVIEANERHGVVIPMNLEKGVF